MYCIVFNKKLFMYNISIKKDCVVSIMVNYEIVILKVIWDISEFGCSNMYDVNY